MVKVLKAIDRGLATATTGLALLAMAILAALAFFVLMVILARYIAGVNLPGFFDAAVYSLIIFPFATAAYALRKGQHVSVDFIVSRLPERSRAALEIATYLASLFFIVILTWQASVWGWDCFRRGFMSTGFWSIPNFYLVGFIAIGAFLLIPQVIKIVLKNIRLLSKHVMPEATSLVRQRHHPFLCVAVFIIIIIASIALFYNGYRIVGLIFLFLVILFSGMPVFLALGLLGCTGLFLVIGSSALIQIPLTVYDAMDNFPLTCLPLFILGGLIMEKGKIVDDLFAFAKAWVGGFASSFLIVTIIVGLIFDAITGSSSGATVILTTTALPVLIRMGYRKSLGCGLCASASMGGMIPPSIGLVVYCAITGESVSKLFMAALVPGVLIYVLFMAYVIGLNVFSKKSLFENGQMLGQSSEHMSWKERFVVTGRAIWGLLCPFIVLGGIYTGIFTPTESGAVLVIYATIVCAVIKRTVGWRSFLQVIQSAAQVCSMILCIIACAFIFALVVTQLQISVSLANFASSAGLGANGVLGLIFATLFIMGMIMSGSAMKVITLPIFYPLAMSVGINSLWLGVFYQILCEMAPLTPPFGLDLFIIQGLTGTSQSTTVRGVAPFVLLMALAIVIIYFFPQLVTWLPSTMR